MADPVYETVWRGGSLSRVMEPDAEPEPEPGRPERPCAGPADDFEIKCPYGADLASEHAARKRCSGCRRRWNALCSKNSMNLKAGRPRMPVPCAGPGDGRPNDGVCPHGRRRWSLRSPRCPDCRTARRAWRGRVKRAAARAERMAAGPRMCAGPGDRPCPHGAPAGPGRRLRCPDCILPWQALRDSRTRAARAELERGGGRLRT